MQKERARDLSPVLDAANVTKSVSGTVEAPSVGLWACMACAFKDNPLSEVCCEWCGMLNPEATRKPEILLQQETPTVARAVEVALADHRACLQVEQREQNRALSNKSSAVPEYIKKRAMDIHRRLTASVSRGEVAEVECLHSLSSPKGEFCPRTGRPLRPSVLNFLAQRRFVRIFDLHLIRPVWRKPSSPLQNLESECLVPCPSHRIGERPHVTSRLRYAFRHFAPNGSLVEPALIAVDKCETCGLNFLETHQSVLEKLPAAVMFRWGIDGDCNRGDPDIILSHASVAHWRHQFRHRQGAMNIEKVCTEACGDELAARAFAFTEHAQLWFAYLHSHVSDEAWLRRSMAEHATLAYLRAEYLHFVGGGNFGVWPIDAPTALFSPLISRSSLLPVKKKNLS